MIVGKMSLLTIKFKKKNLRILTKIIKTLLDILYFFLLMRF